MITMQINYWILFLCFDLVFRHCIFSFTKAKGHAQRQEKKMTRAIEHRPMFQDTKSG